METKGNAVRLAVTIPATTWDALETLATSARFGGNRSRAVTWCIELANVVFTDPEVSDWLFGTPPDALRAYLEAKGGKG